MTTPITGTAMPRTPAHPPADSLERAPCAVVVIMTVPRILTVTTLARDRQLVNGKMRGAHALRYAVPPRTAASDRHRSGGRGGGSGGRRGGQHARDRPAGRRVPRSARSPL